MFWHLRARSALISVFAGVVVLIGFAISPAAAHAAERAPAKNEVLKASLGEALQREIYGWDEERRSLLAEVTSLSPDFAPARWHLGYVKDADRGWLLHDQWQAAPKQAAQLSAYERRREKAADTAEGQLALADWCSKHGLPAQERAHLTRVIDLDANHAVARARLGFVREGNDWISPAEIALDQAREAARQAAMAKWTPVLREIREDLQHRSAARRAKAQERLEAIDDASAASAMESVFADAGDELTIVALGWLAGLRDPLATQVVCRFAVLSPSLDVRQAAAGQLADLPHEQFVPLLLASMYSPVTTQFAAVTLPSGRIGYRHAFVREGQSQRQVMLLDTEYKRIAYVGGSAAVSASRAYDDAAEKAQALEAAAAEQNRQTNALNDRLVWVLKTATRVDLPAQPADWWGWWNEVNEVFVPGSKPVALLHDVQRVEIEDEVPEYIQRQMEEPDKTGESEGSSSESGDSGGGTTEEPRRRRVSLRRVRPAAPQDCLAAGTLVWTARGPLEIETIRVGDLVLSQHPDSGELAYKPVLRTTVRPRGQLVKIEAGGESCETSGGHLFWVAGEGWVKSRDLQSGQILHSASGPVHISRVGPGSEAETYNLIVADFNTYFVGYRKVLSHDNTIRQPTRAVVPGLIPR
jgi:hypothetical protein